MYELSIVDIYVTCLKIICSCNLLV